MEKLLSKISRPTAKYSKRSMLAITANSGGFRICELVEDVYEDTFETNVIFLSPSGTRYSDNCFYKPLLSASTEIISCGLILTEVKMCSISRYLFKLQDSEIDKITSAINASYAVLQSALPSSNCLSQLPNTYCNKDDYNENNCVLENAESFDNYTLRKLNIAVDVNSIIQNLEIDDLSFPEIPCQSHEIRCENELTTVHEVEPLKIVDAVSDVDLSIVENSQSSYVPSQSDFTISSSVTETKYMGSKRTCERKLNNQKQRKSISRSSKICAKLNEGGDGCSDPSNPQNPSQSDSKCETSSKTKLEFANKFEPNSYSFLSLGETEKNDVTSLVSELPCQTLDINSNVGLNNKPSTVVKQSLEGSKISVNPDTSKKEMLINVQEKQAIYFSTSTKKQFTNKRVYDKKHVCLYCNTLACKITRHLSSCHSSEIDVAKLLSLPVKSMERKNGFIELMRMGDFFHNSHVLAVEEGELILVRRPSKEESHLVTYKDFGPCPKCTGFMLKKHLWHHTRECFSVKKGKESTDVNKFIQQQSNALMSAVLHPNVSEAFRKNVLSKMIHDNIGEIAKSDETILSFGMMMVETHEDEQYDLTRQSMRQLARLLIELRTVTNYPQSSLREFIKPSYFDDIILAVKNISGVNNCSEKIIPSLALKLGYHIQKCAAIQRGKALRLGNSEEDKSCRDFLDLYTLEWQTKISSSALNVMNKRNMNSVDMIPLTSDLMKINSALTSELKTRLNDANDPEMDSESWLKLAKITLCRLIMFNKKRGGEAAKITIQQYASKPDWNAENAENFLESLTDLERHLIEKLTLIEIRGKRRKVVPVLLTEDVNKAITVLINTREAAGVSKYNPYIFARPYCNSLQPLRGSDCIRDFVKSLSLQKPKLVSSTRLRKYIATTSQVFDLHENEVDWLARHLGHDINVHRNFYRIHHSAIELTKVSKLLMAVDKGKINQFAGKTLDEINMEGKQFLFYC